MTDNELSERLRGAYSHVAAATLASPPPAAELSDRYASVSAMPHRPRRLPMLATMAAAAAVVAAVVLVGARSTPDTRSTTTLDYSTLEHLALWKMPDGYGFTGSFYGSDGMAAGESALFAPLDAEGITFTGPRDQQVLLFALKPGDRDPRLDVAGSDVTLGQRSDLDARGRRVAMWTYPDGHHSIDWEETDGLRVVAVLPSDVDPVEFANSVVPLDERQAKGAYRRFGFGSVKECRRLSPAVRTDGGPQHIEVALEGSMQRGVNWFVNNGSALLEEPTGTGRVYLTRDPSAPIRGGVGSIFAHPGYPGYFIVVVDADPLPTCEEMGMA